ncbi:MAG: nicotinate-nucleotide diphosphorylase (carboxylating) [Chromatiales bacterium 21-64-14]|nr:MAG: nicotinate-nucleotide diphosphorylase (carboxylating) [Chromatiales bacterium 21-64-14]HQU16521.1 carboxylating nicotinate-nucleotide diphosphorylase [Gammaproteobacteria bacterium]
MRPSPTPPDIKVVVDDVRRALAEDVGDGDRTANLVPADRSGHAWVISREAAVLCGVPWFTEVFQQLDSAVQIQWSAHDGDRLQAGQRICALEGPAHALLTGERTALNFLQLLSGIATRARRYADAVAGLPVRILDTRKTLPGLRAAQKYAVRCGGCHNHRMGLYDAVLIKENHIAACGSITTAVQAARHRAQTPVEVEVENLEQLQEALNAGADRLLLDNFEPWQLREAVTRNGGRARLEASGGIRLESIREIAATGVDELSVGALTKDVEAVDLSMRFAPPTGVHGSRDESAGNP